MEAIQLNEKFRVEKDTYSWMLIFNEEREKKNKETGIKELFMFQEKWYYPDAKQVLKKFVDLELKESNSIEEIAYRLGQIETTINNLSKTIFKKQ